jgi:TetR/AcrR family transcriptional regulator, transcriptional repressor for nem operon
VSHPTREALLQAGLRLAEQHGLANMSVNEVVAAAGVAKGTFYVHFPDRTAYLVALHQWFHDQLKAAVLAATADLAPGPDRLQRGALAYLDGCLQAKAVKALLLEARSEPAIMDEVKRRNADFGELARQDIAAMGWPHAAITARFFVVMTAEAAIIELELGHADAATRDALFQFLAMPR